jgi:ureidoacrylate peracid hydrolase
VTTTSTTGKRPEILSALENKAAPRHTALLVVDMLNDFLDPNGKTAVRANRPIDHARAVIPTQKKLIASARDAAVRVVYVNHTTLRDYASASGPWLDARSRATFSVEDLCLDGTWGAQVIDELKPVDGDLAVEKYRYSGFAGTNLDLVLRSTGVRTVVCAGVSTNACVEATAREAFSLDYYVLYAGDACASWDMALHQATLATASHRYAVVCETDELTSVWRRG